VADAVSRLARVPLVGTEIDQVLQVVADLAAETIPGADEVSVTLLRNDHGATAAYSGELAVAVDERQYEVDRGPCLDAARGYEVLVTDDMRTETRWPDYSPAAAEKGALSSVSIPLPIQEDVLGALNVYSRELGAFDDESVAVGRVFADHAAIAVGNVYHYSAAARVADQMREAMASRAVIEQAKGILMAQRRIGASEAFDVLVEESQHQNVKLRQIAEQMVREIEH
jgi:GAF domain-containing protein